MTNPITPLPKLVEEWFMDQRGLSEASRQHITTAAARWGADQEFYATVEALTEYFGCGVELTSGDAREVLYELRRPHIALDGWGNEKQ